MSATFTVRGHKIRTASQRRYIVAIVQPRERTVTVAQWNGEAMVPAQVVVPAGARIHKRSDSIATARQHAQRYGYQTGGSFAVVVDTATGSEV
jgi:hypothetical protein